MQRGEDEFELVALGVPHVVAMVVAVCVRLMVAAILLYVGVWWLQNTTLSFIMQFDELVFSTMLTLRGRTRLCQLRPLPLPSAQKPLLLCLRPFVVSLGLVVLIGALTPSLQDNVRTMEDLQRYLCRGRQDFVYSFLPSTGWPIRTDTDDYSGGEGTLGRLAEAAVWNDSAVARNLSLDVPSRHRCSASCRPSRPSTTSVETTTSKARPRARSSPTNWVWIRRDRGGARIYPCTIATSSSTRCCDRSAQCGAVVGTLVRPCT